MGFTADSGKVELQHLAHCLGRDPQHEAARDYRSQRCQQMGGQSATVDCDVSLGTRTSLEHLFLSRSAGAEGLDQNHRTTTYDRVSSVTYASSLRKTAHQRSSLLV